MWATCGQGRQYSDSGLPDCESGHALATRPRCQLIHHFFVYYLFYRESLGKYMGRCTRSFSRVRMSLCGRRGFFVAIIYILTFALVLPVLCHKLGFSTYFAKPKEPYKLLEIQNDERTKHARENLETLKQRTKPLSPKQSKQIEFLIVVLTAFRAANTHYLLQVTARLLPQVTDDGGRSILTILNSDPKSRLNEDAHYLSSFITLTNSSAPLTSNLRSREKEDYVVGLETVLQYNSTYVLMIEDDALPSENLLKDLRFVLRHKMPWKFLKTRRDWAFLKLYYPEKWQGFGWPELPELILVGFLGGCFGAWIELKLENPLRFKKQFIICAFIVWSTYFFLVVYTVGRAHLIELRKLSAVLYSVVKAHGCCTPGVLYQRSHALELAKFLKSVNCNEAYPMDVAIDDFAKNRSLERYVVIPNMVSHIGVHSSLSNSVKHFAEFYLMFKP